MATKDGQNENRLLTALACGATVEGAANSSGFSQATIYRRLKDPAFKARLHQLRADMVQRTAGALTAAAMESVRTLLELQKPSNPATVRLGAARSVLELGVKLRENGDLEERINALEQQLAAGGGGRTTNPR